MQSSLENTFLKSYLADTLAPINNPITRISPYFIGNKFYYSNPGTTILPAEAALHTFTNFGVSSYSSDNSPHTSSPVSTAALTNAATRKIQTVFRIYSLTTLRGAIDLGFPVYMSIPSFVWPDYQTAYNSPVTGNVLNSISLTSSYFHKRSVAIVGYEKIADGSYRYLTQSSLGTTGGEQQYCNGVWLSTQAMNSINNISPLELYIFQPNTGYFQNKWPSKVFGHEIIYNGETNVFSILPELPGDFHVEYFGCYSSYGSVEDVCSFSTNSYTYPDNTTRYSLYVTNVNNTGGVYPVNIAARIVAKSGHYFEVSKPINLYP